MSQLDYNAQTIENNIQQKWQESQAAKTVESLNKPSFYCLSMLPYPSGEIHMGHVRNYTLGDVVSRLKMMQGYQVLQPLGWDAFGLPAENAAIKHQLSPYSWTMTNIQNMKNQLLQFGFHIDWSRELTTCSANYYKWNQWIFLKLYEKGLAYQKESYVNWDPVDNTVLANEQVINGCGWRSGAKVEQKKINQWFFKTTAYAEELLSGLDDLNEWPEEVKNMQRNWIGKSNGVEVDFKVESDLISTKLTIFTTRIETIYGVSFLAISPNNPLSENLASESKEISDYISKCNQNSVAEANQANLEKTGIKTNLFAINPINNKPVPVWICNYVLDNFGTGCVMGVPAHDQRDYEFAKKYDLEILPVIDDNNIWDYSKSAFIATNGSLINSDKFNNLSIKAARQAIVDSLTTANLGRAITNFKLRDWGISRQRYWGTPIPIVYCDACGVVPEKLENLPVKLPILDKLSSSGNSLEKYSKFTNTNCPKCNKKARRETDTMDTFVDSSWYFLRYTCPNQEHSILDDRTKFWTPIDQYIGGVEHAIMHLLYARFIHKTLRDLGLVNSNEPFKKLLTQGMVLKDGQKMSKSKGNTVSPQKLIDQYGADTIRLYSMFTSPPEQTLEWSDSGLEGANRFIKKLWNLAINTTIDNNLNIDEANNYDTNIRNKLHTILKQINFDYERQQFNTVVSGAMKLLNILTDINKASDQVLLQEGLSILLRILAPITPHISQYLWEHLKFGDNIFATAMPVADIKAMITEKVELIVQINGKLRGNILINLDSNKEDVTLMAQQNPKITKYLIDKKIKKIIFVDNKLINFVI